MTNTEFRTGVIKPVECLKEGWQLIKDQYWLMFAITLVGMLIGGATLYILVGAMMCGIYFCYLKKIDGQPVSFDDLWVGFQKVLPGFLLMLLFIVPLVIVYAVIYVPILMAAAMGSKLSQNELTQMLIGAFVVDAVLIVLMTCFHTLLIFSFPLLVDRNVGVWQAITLSARAVWKNLGGIAGMLGAVIVLTFVGGVLTCGLGLYFVMPIILAGYVVAYRKIFPSPHNQNFNAPPSPDAFYGAGRYT